MYDTYLYHHGIKGQKWGVRRYQNKDGSYTEAGKERRRKNSPLDKIGSMKVGEVPPELIDAGIYIATTAATLAISALINKKQIANDKRDIKNDYYNAREIKDLASAPRLKHKEDPLQSADKVNKDFPKPGTTENCVLCTTAMVMRQKGYDVSAIKDTGGHMTPDCFDVMFDGDISTIKCSPKKFHDKSLSMPDGSYGDLSVTWKEGGGHSIFWTKENGKLKIIDGQSNTTWDEKILMPLASRVRLTRLDNVTPNDYTLGFLKGGHDDYKTSD